MNLAVIASRPTTSRPAIALTAVAGLLGTACADDAGDQPTVAASVEVIRPDGAPAVEIESAPLPATNEDVRAIVDASIADLQSPSGFSCREIVVWYGDSLETLVAGSLLELVRTELGDLPIDNGSIIIDVAIEVFSELDPRAMDVLEQRSSECSLEELDEMAAEEPEDFDGLWPAVTELTALAEAAAVSTTWSAPQRIQLLSQSLAGTLDPLEIDIEGSHDR